MASTDVIGGGNIEPRALEDEMRTAYLDYAMSVIVGRALPDVRDGLKPVHRRDPLLDGRVGPGPDPAVLEVGAHRRRGDGQLPPARRLRDLRHARPDGAGLLHALSAGRRPGQLRLHRRRSRRGDALHRGAPHPPRHRDAPRSRRGHGRLHAQLRRLQARAARPAGALPQPARQRLLRDRRGHGDEHPAAQPARGHRRGRRPHRRSGDRHRRAHAAHQGPGLPDGRDHPRAPGHPRRLRDRPRARPRPREGPHRGHRARQGGDHRHRAALHGEEGRGQRPRQEDRRPRPREAPHRHREPRGPVRPARHAARRRAQARRDPRGRPQPALQAHADADDVRRQHGRARRQRAPHAAAAAGPRRVRPAPARGHRPAVQARARRPRAPRARPRGPAHRAGQPGCGDRDDPRLARSRRRPGAAHRALQPLRHPGLGHPRHASVAADGARGRHAAHRARRQARADRRAAGHPRRRAARPRDHQGGAPGDRGAVRRRAAHAHHRLRGRDRHRGPDRRPADGHHDHEVRLHQVAAAGHVPPAAPRRPGRDRDGHEGRRLHRAPLRDVVARLPALLLQPRQGLPLEGLRAAGGVADGEGPCARQRAAAAGGRADPVRAVHARLHGGQVPHLRRRGAAW